MGMFDTFWGEYRCPDCGNIVGFEEQTKDYGCLLEDFYLGDYVDRGNRNYFYEFESYCPKCHAPHEISLAIRRGQYVGIFFKNEADEINILELENIEDGYQRRIDYEKMCSEKLGSESSLEKLEKKHVGDIINALKTDWKIEEVYARKTEGRKERLFGFEHLYRVTDGIHRRQIITCTGMPGTILYLEEDKLDEFRSIQKDAQGSMYITWGFMKFVKQD